MCSCSGMRDGLYTLGIPGPGAARTCAGAQKGQVSLRKFPQLDHMPWKKPLKTSQHPEIEVPQTTSEPLMKSPSEMQQPPMHLPEAFQQCEHQWPQPGQRSNW
mmetsp:Transcript_32336/g.66487  ORF Transcript_32336/g.66487 Transcript_32336/m.66487 type:complete len:103 (+) Transcript_32336:79-387(+)